MTRIILLAHLCLMTSIYAINRPVYKIVLTQKGYAQFLQYDVDTPPLREFTFCTWIRLYDLTNKQTIFKYIVNGNNRIMRLWLDSGGKNIQLSVGDKVASKFDVSLVKDVWRHVCLSYQSDYGAWAMYLDSRLIACETAQSLHGYVLPGGGSVIIGYGSDDNGVSNGFEGEIFGANMILTSTIEKNYTNRINPHYEQKPFSKNKIRDMSGQSMQYVVLSDLQTERSKNNFEVPFDNSTIEYPFQTANNIVDQVDAIYLETTTNREVKEEEVIDYGPNLNYPQAENIQFDLWKTLNSTFFPTAQTTPWSSPKVLPINEKPPLNTIKSHYNISPNGHMTPNLESFYKVKDNTLYKKISSPKYSSEISDIETPPPVLQKSKVFGQWTSSKFAGNVLNYLKSINFQKKDAHVKRVPPTIPLNKHSDTYPYASSFSITKLRPPSEFVRNDFLQKRFDVLQRQMNVQILEDNLIRNIKKTHSLAQPKNVEITNRGRSSESRKNSGRYYRSAKEKIGNTMEKIYNIHSFTSSSKKKLRDNPVSIIPNKKYKSVLPFLKTLENSGDGYQTTREPEPASDDMYTKTLSQANKWHNVKSYNNDYTPRKFNFDSLETNNNHNNIRHPAIRLKYKHEDQKLVLIEKEDPAIIKGRKLAMEVSDQSNSDKNSVSVLKYNHGYLDKRQKKHTDKTLSEKNTIFKIQKNKHNGQNNFDKHVKLGNTLNERFVIGENAEQTKKSFEGGYSIVPDIINRYKTEFDNEYPIDGSPRVCKNVELYDRVLYVQQDESIDMTNILSPVRAKNIAIEFIMQNYKKCSLTDSKLETNPKLYINWSKTPVRLFGGARPKTTTDLCGFF